jgi:accessory gene regulator protein AgrB
MNDIFKTSSEVVGVWIANNAEKNEDEKEVIVYFFNRLFKYITLFVLVLLISSFLDIVKTSFVALCTLLFLRHRYNGSHLNSSYGCLAYSVSLPIVFSLIGEHIQINLVFIICLYVIFNYLTWKTQWKNIDDECVLKFNEIELRKQKIQAFYILNTVFILNVVANFYNIEFSNIMFVCTGFCLVDYVKFLKE